MDKQLQQIAAILEMIRRGIIQDKIEVSQALLLFDTLPDDLNQEYTELLHASLLEQGKIFLFLGAVYDLAETKGGMIFSSYCNVSLTSLLAQDVEFLPENIGFQKHLYAHVISTSITSSEEEEKFNMSELFPLLQVAMQSQNNVVKHTLKEIAQQHPQALGEVIGTTPIIIDRASQPLKPTAQNWVAVYTKTEGVMQHDDLARGNFVYRSQITRSLSTADRTKVVALLTAYDRGTALTVDVDAGQILWNESEVDITLPQQETAGRSAGEKHAARNHRITPIAQRGVRKVAAQPNLKKAPPAENSHGPRARNARIHAQKTGMPQKHEAGDKNESRRIPLGSTQDQNQKNQSKNLQKPAQKISGKQFDLDTPETPPHMHMTAREEGWTAKAQDSKIAPTAQHVQQQVQAEGQKKNQLKVSPKEPEKTKSPGVTFSSGQILPTEEGPQAAAGKKHSPFHIAPVRKNGSR